MSFTPRQKDITIGINKSPKEQEDRKEAIRLLNKVLHQTEEGETGRKTEERSSEKGKINQINKSQKHQTELQETTIDQIEETI